MSEAAITMITVMTLQPRRHHCRVPLRANGTLLFSGMVDRQSREECDHKTLRCKSSLEPCALDAIPCHRLAVLRCHNQRSYEFLQRRQGAVQNRT
jgi:hypothetical protein